MQLKNRVCRENKEKVMEKILIKLFLKDRLNRMVKLSDTDQSKDTLNNFKDKLSLWLEILTTL